MTQNPHDLDAAIDAVARQLTRVEHDPHLSSRIAMSLPDRSRSPFGWWAPRLAIIAVVFAAGMAWSIRGGSDHVPASVLASVPANFPATVPQAVFPNMPQRTNDRWNDRRNDYWNDRWNDRWNARDFEHSLPSIGAVAPLELEAIAPASLAEDAPLTLQPLVIADLPVAESISQR